MINIDIEEHKKTIEVLLEMETTMVNEREVQRQHIDGMRTQWNGDTSMVFLKDMPIMMDSGLYEKTLNQVRKMKQVLEDALPTIVSLKSTCDTLDNCLKGTTPDDSLAVTGNLMLNRVKMDELISTLDKILSYNDSIYSELDGIMNACGGLVDFGNCKDMLEDAYQKIKRMEALKLELSEYASKTEKLDSDLCSLYQEIWQEYGDDIRVLIESGEGEGILEIQKILEMDAGEWSDKQAEQVANMLEHAFQQDNVELIDMCMEYFLKENTFKENNKTGYIVQLDEDAITKITNALERQGKVGETFYTLNRLKNYQYFQEKNGEKLSCMHSVSLVDGKIQITFDIQNRNKNEILDTISFTSQNLKEEIQYTTELQKLGFSADDIEQMRRNTYSDGDIEFLDMLLQKDYENAFEYKLTKCSTLTGENIVSYLMNLETKGNCGEQQKIINTILHNSEYNNMVYKELLVDYSTHEEYIDLILATLNQEIQTTQVVVSSNYPNMEEDALQEKYEYESRLFRQSSLWSAVQKIYTCDFDDYIKETNVLLGTCRNSITCGSAYAQITDLCSAGEYSECPYKFSFSIYDNVQDEVTGTWSHQEVEGSRYNCTVSITEGEGSESVKQINSIYDKRYQIKMLPIKLAGDVVFGGAGINSDQVNVMVEGLSDENKEILLTSMMDFSFGSYCEKLEGLDTVLGDVAPVVNRACEYLEFNREIATDIEDIKGIVMGKASCLTIECEADTNRRAILQLQSEPMTAISAVRSMQILEEDGVKYFLQDVCEEDLGEDEYKDILKNVNIRRDTYIDKPKIDNFVELLNVINDNANGIKTNGINIYSWLQGADVYEKEK